jgi:acid stress-induced BolA-like protein IbaG/YrbA
MTPAEVKALIEAGLPQGATVRVLSDDDTHFEALVVSERFEGLRTLQRHQVIYGALGPRMGREIHALSIQAYSPAEWLDARGQSC